MTVIAGANANATFSLGAPADTAVPSPCEARPSTMSKLQDGMVQNISVKVKNLIKGNGGSLAEFREAHNGSNTTVTIVKDVPHKDEKGRSSRVESYNPVDNATKQ